jgi:anti-sigma regulatory factor (Ser/Thr protein kinase)
VSAIIDARQTFRHEALLYSGWADFVAGTVPFIRGGIEAGEPVLIVESPEKIDLLRGALDKDADSVLFADMAEVGANPARIIPAWRDFVTRYGGAGSRLRGIGEPIWNGRTSEELVECQRHESLLNVAFGGGQPWWLLCPYDTGQLDSSVIAEARRSHEFVTEVGASHESHQFRGIDACGPPFDSPLSEPTGISLLFDFVLDNMPDLRVEVTRFATTNGMSATRAMELVSAVNEIATNSIQHGGGRGTLRLWTVSNGLVCEVRDGGAFTDPLIDRLRPGPNPAAPRGLWLANQLCDLVQIRTLGEGTVVRLHMKIDPRRHLHLVPEGV